jgi:hypothetical protein
MVGENTSTNHGVKDYVLTKKCGLLDVVFL